MHDVLIGALAYLIGTFPSAFIYSKLFRGLDIRKVGSGNVGGMNTLKYVGKLPGVLTIITDIGKGVLAVYLASLLGEGTLILLLAALLAVLGHNYNPFLRFKGGKGLGTTLGALLMLSPIAVAYMLLLMALLLLLLRDANTAAGSGILALPVMFWFLHHDWLWVAAGAVMGLVICSKHLKDFREYREGRRRLI